MTAIEDFLAVRAGRYEIMHAWFGFPVAETRVFLCALADMFPFFALASASASVAEAKRLSIQSKSLGLI